ncbi:MAG: glycosyltransferase family 2 protein, partial [Deltaproteobacteria bacterium]|nr:glycosyltransferase family 2 protein [Deltaproteobacteria bacterium]
MGLYETLLFGEWLYDINAQPNMFHRDFFAKWQDPPLHFGLDLYAYVMAKVFKLQIIRVPVLFPERVHGESHFHTNIMGKVRQSRRVVLYSRGLKRSLKT